MLPLCLPPLCPLLTSLHPSFSHQVLPPLRRLPLGAFLRLPDLTWDDIKPLSCYPAQALALLLDSTLAGGN